MEPLKQGETLTEDVLALKNGQERITYVELRSATAKLHEAAVAYKAAQANYQAALLAFNKFVSPDGDQ